ncbi:MAG: hypothetical protein WAL87_05220 [Chthoniobacterales bacterium]
MAATEVIRVRVIPSPDHLSLTTMRDRGGMLTGSLDGIRRVEGPSAILIALHFWG